MRRSNLVTQVSLRGVVQDQPSFVSNRPPEKPPVAVLHQMRFGPSSLEEAHNLTCQKTTKPCGLLPVWKLSGLPKQSCASGEIIFLQINMVNKNFSTSHPHDDPGRSPWMNFRILGKSVNSYPAHLLKLFQQ